MTEATLPNGLRVIVVPTGFPDIVSLQIPVQTGSRNEVEPGKSGFAHFFEHMMFRGTERFPAHDYQAIISGAGARQNAYTTDDYTNYHVTFAREDLARILEIEADRFQHLAYAEEAFRTEARAVLGEYNKSSAEPLMKLFEVQQDTAYTLHPYKHTTMGFLADIEAMPEQYAYSRTFFERWYRPEYTTLIVAGDVDPASVLDLVAAHWSSWQPGGPYPVAIPPEPAPRGPLSAHVPWPAGGLPWLSVAFHGPAFSVEEPGYAALDLLLDLAFGETSAIYQRLVERDQVCDQFAPHVPARKDPSLAGVLARLKHPDGFAAVRDAVLAAVAELRDAPLPAARVEAGKAHNRYAFVRALDNSESIAATLARFVHFERSASTLNRLFDAYERLTPADLHAAARRYLTPERLVVTTLAGDDPGVSVRSVSSASFDIPATSQRARLPLIRQPGPLPLVRIKLAFEAGSAFDPPGKEGRAALAAAMVAEGGSRARRIEEIRDALFPMAGSFDVRVDRELVTFTGAVHRDRLDAFADLVLPQLVEPGLREEDFTRLKERQRNALTQDLRANNEEELGRERLQTTVFAGTRYGHTTLGTVAGVDGLSLRDVSEALATGFVRSRLTIGLAGDAPDGFAEAVERRLQALPGGDPTVRTPIAGRQPRGLEVDIIEKDSRAVAISLGHPLDVRRGHPDFAALCLARSWFGEHRASQGRLFQRLRELRGLNYGDYAYVEAFPGAMYGFFPPPNVPRRAQLFEIWVRPVEPQHALFALKLAIWELRRLLERGLTEAEFSATREYLVKNLPLMTKTQDQQLGYAIDSAWYGTGPFVAEMREQLAALTAQTVNDALRRHLSGSDLHVVMVAKDATKLADAIRQNERAGIAYPMALPPDVIAEDAEVGALSLGVGSVRITAVDDVFAR